MMNAKTWMGVGLAVGTMVGACYRYDPTYCGNLNGHESCRYLGLGQYCSLCDFEKDGCVEERPSDHCLAPFEIPGESESSSGDIGSDSGETGMTGSSSESGSEPQTGSSSSTGGGPCVGSEDCSGDAPFCNPVGECVSCDAMEDPDEACSSADFHTPLCVGGTCVECTAASTSVCDGQLRVCDPVTNECVDCNEHAECWTGACRFDEGLCFPPDLIAHVDADGGREFLSVGAAVASFNDGSLGMLVIHERNAGAPYTEAVVVDAGKILAFVPAPGETAVIQGSGANPGISVVGAGTTLYLDDITVSGGSNFGMLCNGARADVRRGRVVQNAGGGIRAQGACALSIENSFIGGDVDTDALDVQSSSASVLYSTLAASAMIAGTPTALRCNAASTVEVRNAILVGASTEPELVCSVADVSNSASETTIPGSGNAAVGNFTAGWFGGFVTGDFSLSASGGPVFEGIARWETGDPVADIDGDARPGVDGSSDHAGADVP